MGAFFACLCMFVSFGEGAWMAWHVVRYYCAVASAICLLFDIFIVATRLRNRVNGIDFRILFHT